MHGSLSTNLIRGVVGSLQHAHCACHASRSVSNTPVPSYAIHQLGKHNASSQDLRPDYAFEMAASNLRFGDGVTAEVGLDLKNMRARKVGVFTDSNIVKLPVFKVALESLDSVPDYTFEVYDRAVVEPTEESWLDAIEWSRMHDFSHFLAVGGGSVIDTAKAANLLTVYKESSLMDFVNAPVGKALPVTTPLRPLIAVPTTAGTGSETTTSAIFDVTSKSFKTGISTRALRPTLGIIDFQNTETCPTAVHISAGLDVLFHALESYTAIPYDQRTPRPANPWDRPPYQGSNPAADIFSLWALKTVVKYLPRLARDTSDAEARKNMQLAAAFAGIGFGNAGCHLPHALSYPISGLNKSGPKYKHPGYLTDGPIVPHGISVAVTAPSVFRHTASTSPDRHRVALSIFTGSTSPSPNIDVSRITNPAIGEHLRDAIAVFLSSLDGVPRGLQSIGYSKDNLEALVDGTLPQRRVLSLAPGAEFVGSTVGEEGKVLLRQILEDAMEW